MNAKVLASMKKVLDDVSKRLERHFDIYTLNTCLSP